MGEVTKGRVVCKRMGKLRCEGVNFDKQIISFIAILCLSSYWIIQTNCDPVRGEIQNIQKLSSRVEREDSGIARDNIEAPSEARLAREEAKMRKRSHTRQQVPKKRLRTTFGRLNEGAASSSQVITTDNNNNNNSSLNNRSSDMNGQAAFYDLNNNMIDTNQRANINKPTVENGTSGDSQTWCRNVNSINGTIDLSQYKANDVDRLYGDALLVYFKNFNE